MDIWNHTLRALAHIRSSYRDNPVNPVRDWFMLLAALITACALLILVSVSVFRSVRADVELAAARGSGVETIDRTLLKETIGAFRKRAATTERFFETPPVFADPSR